MRGDEGWRLNREGGCNWLVEDTHIVCCGCEKCVVTPITAGCASVDGDGKSLLAEGS